MISNTRFPLVFFLLLCASGTSWAQVKVDRIEITGNERTRDWVITREWSLLSPDSIIYEDVSEHILTFENRVRNTNLFNKVEAALRQEGETYVLMVKVVEKWYTWPIPFVEFSDRNFNIWEDLDFGLDRTNYGLYLFNYNLFGANHSAKLSLVQGYNRKYGLEYRIPVLGKASNTGITLRLQHDEQDELWHHTANDKLGFFAGEGKSLVRHDWGAFGLQHQLEAEVIVGFSWAISRFRIAEQARYNTYGQAFLQDGKREQLHHFTGAYLQLDNRNNRYFATEGRFTQLSIEQEFGDLSNLRFRFDHRSYQPLGGDHAVAFGAYLEHNTNDGRAYRNNRMMGYDRIVRGYEDYVVDGRSAVLLKSAYRYHLLQHEYPLDWVPYLNYKFLPIRSFLEVYADGGYVQSNTQGPDNRLPNSMLYGMGIGLNVLAYNDKVFRFEYSVNAEAHGGWYVHFVQSI